MFKTTSLSSIIIYDTYHAFGILILDIYGLQLQYISAPDEDPFKGSTAKDSKLQKKKEKKPKQNQNNSNKKAAPAVDPNLPDICKLEFKVGVITKVWVHPEADKLYCEEIDVGEEEGPRQIASGLRAHYSEEEMLGKRVLVVANLKVSRLFIGL